MAGSIEAGTAYTPRKLCEELREVNVGTDDDGNFNPSVVPELQRFARWLNVIVVSDVVRYTMEPDRLVSEHVSLAALDPLIWFPLGTRVYVETLLPGDAIVHGYVVKPQQDMSWDVVSPRCAGCGKPTEYGAECSIVEREGKRVIMGVCCEDGITP